MASSPTNAAMRTARTSRLTEARWEVECRLMAERFPESRPFEKDGMVGFTGVLRGPQSLMSYRVIVRAKVSEYPLFWPPAIYVEPRPNPHLHMPDGSLSYHVLGKPPTSCFASAFLVAATYIHAYDDGRQDPFVKTIHGGTYD